MDDFLAQLQEHFRRQAQFATDYSPLYACICDTLADRLAVGDADPLNLWLASAAAHRRPFEAPLLLLAGLHYAVLAGDPAATELARFYPTAGGAFDGDAAALGGALRRTIIDRQDWLAGFIGSANVQTNETARGLSWLWPAELLGGRDLHLVDLGASAGLNLTAEQRGYELVGEGDGRSLARLGAAAPQFRTICHGKAPSEALADLKPPRIVSRLGGDIAPFYLRTPEDELTLASFVWADQPARMERLKEGIAALRRVESTATPVRLYPLDLPDGLPEFLDSRLANGPAAIAVLYNTFITVYLEGGQQALRESLADWAADRPFPVLWLQWEPPGDEHKAETPYGMNSWTADLWLEGEHYHWLLACIHPHGTELHWRPGFRDFARFVKTTLKSTQI